MFLDHLVIISWAQKDTYGIDVPGGCWNPHIMLCAHQKEWYQIQASVTDSKDNKSEVILYHGARHQASVDSLVSKGYKGCIAQEYCIKSTSLPLCTPDGSWRVTRDYP